MNRENLTGIQLQDDNQDRTGATRYPDGCLIYRNASVSRAGLKVATWCLHGRVKGCIVRG